MAESTRVKRPMESWNIPLLVSQSPGLSDLSTELADLADEGLPLITLTADLKLSNGLIAFERLHPDKFLQMGISEQNMVSVAAGLATTGLRPYVAGFASFMALLCCEQIRTDIAYTRLPVMLIGHHSGIGFGFYGTSHHATEDIAIMRSIANMTVVCPADSRQMRLALRAYSDHPLPVYFRIGRGREPIVYDDPDYVFTPGAAHIHGHGEALTLIATGSTVHAALGAATLLSERGVSTGVIDMHTVKPIDRDAILSAAQESSAIMTVEEHNIFGGLGGAVAEVLTEAGVGVRLKRHGINDVYSLIGPPTALYRHYKLDSTGIAEVAEAFVIGGA